MCGCGNTTTEPSGTVALKSSWNIRDEIHDLVQGSILHQIEKERAEDYLYDIVKHVMRADLVADRRWPMQVIEDTAQKLYLRLVEIVEGAGTAVASDAYGIQVYYSDEENHFTLSWRTELKVAVSEPEGDE